MNLFPGVVERRGNDLQFKANDLSIALPAGHPAGQAEDVTLGIRPEFLFLDPPADAAQFEGRVEAVEHLGAETIIEISTGGPEITAKIERKRAMHHGATVRLGADPNKVLAFEVNSSNRLRT